MVRQNGALTHKKEKHLASPFFVEALRAAAGSVDAELSFLSFLELYRTDVAQRRMTLPGVVEAFDVVEHVCPGLLATAVDLPGNALGPH